MAKKIFSEIQIILIFASAVFAYDFAALREAMFQNNPELLTLQEEYRRSELDVKDAWAGLGPTIDMQVSGTYMLNPPVDAVYLNVDDIVNSVQWPSGVKPVSSGQYVKIYDGMENTLYSVQFTLTQPLFTWGKLENAISLYNQISKIKLTQLESKQQQLETELETRLISLKYLERINEIIEEEKLYADRLVKVSENAEKSGMFLHQDVVEARIQAKELEIAQQDLLEQINNQILELKRSTGIEDLNYEQLEYELDEEMVLAVLTGEKQEMEENALSGDRLSIKLITQLKEMNKTAEKIAKGAVNWKPDVALQATGGYGGSRVPLLEPNWRRKDDYTLNFSIGIKTTIWDGGKKVRDVSRRISETKTADINQLDARSTIKKTFNEQWNTAEVCTMKIEYQNLKIEASDSKIKQKETIYETGYGSETDVLNAKIERCNQIIEKEKQSLSRAAACMTIKYLCK